MLISLRVLILLAARELQSSLKRSSGQTMSERREQCDVLLLVIRVSSKILLKNFLWTLQPPSLKMRVFFKFPATLNISREF